MLTTSLARDISLTTGLVISGHKPVECFLKSGFMQSVFAITEIELNLAIAVAIEGFLDGFGLCHGGYLVAGAITDEDLDGAELSLAATGFPAGVCGHVLIAAA